jgi:hypothetical protein
MEVFFEIADTDSHKPALLQVHHLGHLRLPQMKPHLLSLTLRKAILQRKVKEALREQR